MPPGTCFQHCDFKIRIGVLENLDIKQAIKTRILKNQSVFAKISVGLIALKSDNFCMDEDSDRNLV